MKKIILLMTILLNNLSFAGPGDGTLPPLRALAIVIDTGTSQQCKVFPIKTEGLKSLEKNIEIDFLKQDIKLESGKDGMKLEVKTPKSPIEKLLNVLENNDEVITILHPEQKIKEILILTNSKESLAAFLTNNGC